MEPSAESVCGSLLDTMSTTKLDEQFDPEGQVPRTTTTDKDDAKTVETQQGNNAAGMGAKSPAVSALPRKEWSTAEDELIRNCVGQMGCRWRLIAAQLQAGEATAASCTATAEAGVNCAAIKADLERLTDFDSALDAPLTRRHYTLSVSTHVLRMLP